MKRRHFLVPCSTSDAHDEGKKVPVCEDVHCDHLDALPEAKDQVPFGSIMFWKQVSADALSAQQKAKAAMKDVQLAMELLDKQGKELERFKEEDQRYAVSLTLFSKNVQEYKEEVRRTTEQVKQIAPRVALVERQAQAVEIHFFVQYVFQVISAAAKLLPKPSDDSTSSEMNALEAFNYFLDKAKDAGSFELDVLHPSLPLPFSVCKLDVAPFAELLRRLGSINGLISNHSCYSCSLKSMGAAIEGQLRKIDQGQVGILSKSDLLELRSLFQELFRVSTMEAVQRDDEPFLVQFFLPDSNQKVLV